MKVPASNPEPAKIQTFWRPFASIASAIVGCVLATQSGFAAANDYFGTNNPAGAGYTDASGGNYWGTSTTETGGSAWANADIMVFGINASDFAAVNGFSGGPYAYTIALNNNDDIDGFDVGATNVAITLGGTSNEHFDTSPITIAVTNFSTLIWDNTHDGGFNFNKETVTFTGPGTNIFLTDMGGNDTAVLSQGAEAGGAANNVTVILDEASYGSYSLSGGYDLYSGNLIFATPAACNSALNSLSSGKYFQIGWGSPGPNPTIDNTTGSSQTLALGSGTYSLAGDFTFVGSSSLSLGSQGVELTGNPRQITVENNTLSIFGVISNSPSTSGDGINKLGAGTLQLGASNTYNGPTFVFGGTLQLTNSGSIAASSGLVVSNATFDISGLATAETTLSSLSLSNSPTLVVSEPAGSVTNIIATALNLDGTPVTVNFSALPAITGYPVTFPILDGTTINGTPNFILGSMPPSPGNAYQGYLTSIPASGLVELVLTNGPAPVMPLTWTGSVNGSATETWDVGNTADWRNSSGQATAFQDGDPVTFDDTATGSKIVNMVTTVTPDNLTVNNSASSYTFTGGHLGNDYPNTLTLNKEGSGTLTLQESGDNFSGGINVSGGTVIIDNNSGDITGGATIAAGSAMQLGNNDMGDQLPQGIITVNGSLTFDCADNLTTVNSAFAGAGTVMQISTNTVLLNDSGSSSGNWSTVVTSGTLQVADSSALGSLPGGSVTITNGGTLDLGGDNNQNDANFGAKQFIIAGAGVNGDGTIINSGVYEQEDAFESVTLTNDATVAGPSRWDMRNGTPVLNLNGFTLTVTNISTLALVDATVTPGTIIVQSNANLDVEETCSITNPGTITVENGGALGLYASSHGSVTRNVVLNGGSLTNVSGDSETAYLDSPILMQQNSTVGNLNVGVTTFYDGAISDGGNGLSLSFGGLGTNFLSGTNTYTGATVVNGDDYGNTLGLSGFGSISASSQIIVTNDGIFDVSLSSMPFSGTNTLVLGDDVNGQGTLNLGSTLITNLNSINLINPVLNMAVLNASNPCITVTHLYLGDGTQSGTINITALPPVLPAQFPLIKCANETGTYNLNLGTLPSGYSGNLVNNPANNSIDLQITGHPVGTWNGGGYPDNYWDDAANWDGASLTGNDPLTFAGTVGLNNTNDLTGEIAQSITFWSTAGAFILNPSNNVSLTLNGSIVNESTATETINIPLSYGQAETFNGASGKLIIGGGITNTAAANSLTLEGSGILTNSLASLSPTDTNTLNVSGADAAWTIMDNPSSTPITIPWVFQVNSGTLNFGSGSSAPNLTSTTGHNSPADNSLGTVSGGSATLDISAGSLTLDGPLDTCTALNSTGIVTQAGGTLNINNPSEAFQGANNANLGEQSIVNISGGTMNMGTPTAPNSYTFFLASRGNGTLNMSGSGTLNCSTLDLSRNASGNTFGSIGVVNLNGGVIVATEVSTATSAAQTGPATDYPPSATFNFNGGILRAAASSTTFYQGHTVSPAIPITSIVQAGGAFIDSSNFAISVLEPLQHDSTLGATPDGGLTKLGSGALTLTATNTYTGPTTVSDGTLAVKGSIAAGAVTVETNGTLAGAGTVGGNVTINPGGAIAPGNVGVIGTLTVAGNVGLSGNAEIALNATTLTNSVLVSAGALSLSGTLTVTNISGTLALSNSFKLFNAASMSGTFSATNLPPLNPGLAWNWNPANATLTVVQGVASGSPGITGISLSGGNVTISGTNAQAGATYYLLTSTNLLLPISQWTPVSTNVAAGNNFTFIGTNTVTPGARQQFYILSSTNN